MGKINSKTKYNHISNTSYTKYNYRFPTISRSQSLLFSSWNQKAPPIDFGQFHNKQRLCMKKKVLMLGLDGVGKTDLFARLTCHDKQSSRINHLPQPTIGKFQKKK
jgi:hypothetical protein